MLSKNHQSIVCKEETNTLRSVLFFSVYCYWEFFLLFFKPYFLLLFFFQTFKPLYKSFLLGGKSLFCSVYSKKSEIKHVRHIAKLTLYVIAILNGVIMPIL